MTSLEAGVLIGLNGRPLFWHTPAGRTAGSLPDSRELWDVIWEKKDEILGFAHSHPGGGVPVPSFEDLTTFRAVELALGQKIRWWIVSRTNTAEIVIGPERGAYASTVCPDDDEPGWVWKLREHSYVPDVKAE
jgi:proteasome lid subunit RPN8/RPN11